MMRKSLTEISLSQNPLFILEKKIETHLRSLEEKLMNIEVPQDKYINLTREERSALYKLKNEKKNIVIKSADKGSSVVV